MVEVYCQPSLSALSNRSYNSLSKIDQGSIIGSPNTLKGPKFYNYQVNHYDSQTYLNNGNIINVTVQRNNEFIQDPLTSNYQSINQHDFSKFNSKKLALNLVKSKLKTKFNPSTQKTHSNQDLEYIDNRQQGFSTQRNTQMPKLMIDRDKLLTHRKVQNRQQSLKEIELKYIDILLPKNKNQYSQKKVKLNADSMKDIQSKFCIQSLRDLRMDLNESFKGSQQNIKIPKNDQLQQMKDLIQTERLKGQSKSIVWDQKSIAQYLKYPDNITHKKFLLPSIIMPKRYQSQLSQKEISPNISKQNSMNVTATKIHQSKNQTQTNFASEESLKSQRVRFIQQVQDGIITGQSNYTNKTSIPDFTLAQILESKLRHSQSQLKLKPRDHQILLDNKKKGENLPEHRIFVSASKAKLATQNQMKQYLQQKRQDSSYFMKPNLFNEWQIKQIDKRPSVISKIDNRRNSNQSNKQDVL